MVLDPIPQPLPVHFFGSRPQPPTSRWEAFARFFLGTKGAPQKNAHLYLGVITKMAGLVLWRQNAKWRQTSTESTVTRQK